MIVGIITCQILEEELCYILRCDQDFKRFSIIKSEHSSGFEELLASDERTCILNSVEEFKQLTTPGREVLIEVHGVGLHMNKKNLQNSVVTSITKFTQVCSSVLLGYGLCGNSLVNLDEDLKDVDIPVVMPTNCDGSRIDDCICMALGDTKEYLKEVGKEAGTWFLTPGWIKHNDTMLLKELGAKDVKTVKWIFDKANYSRALKINLQGSYDREAYAAGAEDFAETYQFRLDEREGSLETLINAMAKAKHLGDHR